MLDLQGPAPSPAAYDDGLVEVYGLTAGALKQGWNVRTVESHTKRLGQGHGLKLYVQSSDATEHSVYTLMDGEDWWQRVPAARAGTSVRDGMLVCFLLPVYPCTPVKGSLSSLSILLHHSVCSPSASVLHV